MRVDKVVLGERIAAARKARGIDSAAGLCRALVESMETLKGRELDAKERAEMKELPPESDGKKKPKTTLTPQAVSNWEIGKQIPSWDLMDLLELVLGVDQEELLFGAKRTEQLKRDRIYLVRVTEEEARLVSSFREISKDGQKTVLKLFKSVAEDHPAPEATIHQLRRKDDKSSH